MAPKVRTSECRTCGADVGNPPRGRLRRLCDACEVEVAWCGTCEAALPRHSFNKDRSTRTGLYGICKACNLARQRREKYGIDTLEIEARLSQQRGQCAICCGSLAGGFAVDHCHGSGAVRGLLCTDCNVGLGFFKDDPDRMLSAIAYVMANGGGERG